MDTYISFMDEYIRRELLKQKEELALVARLLEEGQNV